MYRNKVISISYVSQERGEPIVWGNGVVYGTSFF